MDNQKLPFNRGWVVLGAILIQLCLGAIYAWSVYTPALQLPTADQLAIQAAEEAPTPPPAPEIKVGKYGFSTSDTQWPFSIGLITFALVMVLAGNWQKKIGPQKVARTGGIVLGLGYILAGILGETTLTQNLFIGLVGGAGIGLAYVCPIAVGVKWFPDKKGLITGLAVAGFGFGATIWVMLAKGIMSIHFPGLLSILHFSFCNDSGVQSVWFIYGIVYLIAVLIGSIWMVNPPDNYKPAGWEPPPPAKAASTGGIEFSQWDMLKTPQFYMIWFCFIAGATAGLMVIGVISLYGLDALMVKGMNYDGAKSVAAIAMGVFYALFNGLGRIAWGMISDKIGRKMAIFLMCLIQGLAMLSLFYIGTSAAGLWIMAALVGFNFGGNFALYPAATADFFGNKNLGVNYGWMFTAYGVGGLVGPLLLAARFKDAANKLVEGLNDQLAAIVDKASPEALDLMRQIAETRYGAWQAPFMIAGIASLVAAVVILITQKPREASK